MSIIDPSISSVSSFPSAEHNWSKRMSATLLGTLITETSCEQMDGVFNGFKKINFSRAEQIFRKTIPNLPSNICLATTGSDARSEKAPGRESPMEIIVITDPKGADGRELSDEKETRLVEFTSAPPKEAAPVSSVQILDRIQNIVDANPHFDRSISYKQVGGENPIYFYPSPEKPHLVIPTRSLDAQPVFGNPKVLQKFMEKTRKSIGEINSDNLRKFHKNFCVPSLKELESCLDHTSKDAVDLNSGQLHYDGKRIKSVKYPFLRPLQYKFAYDLVRAVKNKEISSDVLQKLPAKIPERLQYLQNQGILAVSQEQTDKAIRAYTRSVQWYLVSQIEFGEGNQVVTVDPAELTQVGKTIYDFVKRDSLIKTVEKAPSAKRGLKKLIT